MAILTILATGHVPNMKAPGILATGHVPNMKAPGILATGHVSNISRYTGNNLYWIRLALSPGFSLVHYATEKLA